LVFHDLLRQIQSEILCRVFSDLPVIGNLPDIVIYSNGNNQCPSEPFNRAQVLESGYSALVASQKHVERRLRHTVLRGGVERWPTHGNLWPEAEGFEQPLILLRGEFRGDRLSADHRPARHESTRSAFFAFAHAGHHILRTLRGMDSRGNGHPRQTEKIVIAHHLQLGRQHLPQLFAQRQVGL
jgi:hypothetical protein